VQDAEQRLAVVLELGALVRAYGVFDGKFVERELARDVGELLVCRAVQPDPGDSVAIATGRGHLREIVSFDDPLAVAIDGMTHNHTRKRIRDANRRPRPSHAMRAPCRRPPATIRVVFEAG
jgi:hypothetical protein